MHKNFLIKCGFSFFRRKEQCSYPSHCKPPKRKNRRPSVPLGYCTHLVTGGPLLGPQLFPTHQQYRKLRLRDGRLLQFTRFYPIKKACSTHINYLIFFKVEQFHFVRIFDRVGNAQMFIAGLSNNAPARRPHYKAQLQQVRFINIFNSFARFTY